MPRLAACALALCVFASAAAAQPAVTEGEAIFRDVAFDAGDRLAEVRVHYRTLGVLRRDAAGHATNAVLILHGTGGSGAQFLQPQFAGELFLPGQLFDAATTFLILPDNIGHGRSSKPSDGLRMRFPKYGYADMVRLQHRLVTEHFRIDRLRVVMGTSMGGMHTWMWATTYPDSADGFVPLAAVPTAIVGRNRMWRTLLAEAIRDDPAWLGGAYTTQPVLGLRNALRLQAIMSSVPLQWQALAPTREAADAFIERFIAQRLPALDANDVLYQFDASRDYDPSPHLDRIVRPVLAINSADDQINPPELGLMEALMPRVKAGRYVLVPISPASRGHSSHTWAVLWRDELQAFLRTLPPR